MSTDQTNLDQRKERRARLVNGLRELADLYQQHPELPAPPYQEFRHCVGADNDEAGIAEVQAIAAVLGTDVLGLNDPDAHITTGRSFGGVYFSAFYVRREDMREYDEAQRHVKEWRAAGKPPITPVVDVPRRGMCRYCDTPIVTDDKGEWIHEDGMLTCHWSVPSGAYAYPVDDSAEAGAR